MYHARLLRPSTEGRLPKGVCSFESPAFRQASFTKAFLLCFFDEGTITTSICQLLISWWGFALISFSRRCHTLEIFNWKKSPTRNICSISIVNIWCNSKLYFLSYQKTWKKLQAFRDKKRKEKSDYKIPKNRAQIISNLDCPPSLSIN